MQAAFHSRQGAMPRQPTARPGTLLDRPMTAEFLRVGCIAHHQRLALSLSCSCSDRSSAQLTTTPATSLQSLQIPRVDPPIALPASFSKCLNVHNRLQMAVTLPLPACHRHFPSITNPGICLPKANRHKPRHLSASGQPVRALSYLPAAGQHELRKLAASGQPAQSVPITTPSVAQARLAECKGTERLRVTWYVATATSHVLLPPRVP